MYQVAHTRLCITPSGPLHIGHAWNALLNKRLAQATGGSFQLRFEVNLLNKRVNAAQLDEWTRTNTEELEAFGLGPTEPYCTDADYMEGAHLLWRLCGGRERWGLWGHQSDMSWRAQSVHLGGLTQEHQAEYLNEFRVPAHVSRQGVLPYWVTFSRVAVDMLSGRNVVLRGADLAVDMQLYCLFAAEIASRMERAEPPLLLYYPLVSSDIMTTGPDAGTVRMLSSSTPSVTDGFYLRDLLAQGLTGEWLEKALWGLLVQVELREVVTPKEITPATMLTLLPALRPVTVTHAEWEEVCV